MPLKNPTETKIFEVRDSMTFIPVVATRLRKMKASEMTLASEEDRSLIFEQFLLGRGGWGPGQSLIHYSPLNEDKATTDPYQWGSLTNRTHFNAHKYISEHWDELESGSVIDIEYILGETEEPKESEYFTQFGLKTGRL